jgi:hypothetical protein
MKSRLVLVAAAVAVALALPGLALANAAAPWQPGDVVGEPDGDLADIHIEAEQLSFDLRPLADGEPVQVDAVYQLRNDGTSHDLNLVFVANALADRDGAVAVDGRPVPYTPGEAPAGPPQWQPPKTTPGITGAPITYATQNAGSLSFSVAIPTGKHEMHVRYMADASAYSGNEPTRYWQLAYVLAPARQWASFGTLDVDVSLPSGWNFASEPALNRNGDIASAQFQGIPSDSLALTTQMAISKQTFNFVPIAVVSALAFVGCVFAWWLGARRGRRGESATPVVALALVWSVVTGFVVAYAALATNANASVPPSQAPWGYNFSGIGDVLSLLMWVVLILIVLTLAIQLCAELGARRARRARGPIYPGFTSS